MALPKGLAGLAVRAARSLPDPLLERILPPRLGFVDPSSLTEPDPGAAPVRLFIGPVNFAGQGWQWAHAATRFLPGVSATAMAYTTGTVHGFPVDQRVPASVYLMSRKWQNRQRRLVSTRYTHVILEAGRSLFGDVYRQSVLEQVRALQHAGVKVAMLTHGSDMRVPSRHLAAHEFSPFAPGEWSSTGLLEEETARNHRLRRDSDLPVFASTPGMLEDVPDATWLPVVVEPERWAAPLSPLQGEGPPLVVHAPSSTAVKGTHLVEPVLHRMVAEGLIRYERVEGLASVEVPDRFRSADIVLDQFRIGDYGVAACEALAAGRLVLGNVDDHVRSQVVAATGRTLPVVQADPRSIERVLRDVVDEPARYRAIAAKGPDFVRHAHDGRLSARALAGFLGLDASE